MILSVVSGKGGAGKTAIATTMAVLLGADFYDLDVDAPNSEAFLKPVDLKDETVCRELPVIDPKACDLCGVCTRACQYNALYRIGEQVYLSQEICSGCRVCQMVCPQTAIQMKEAPMGRIRRGTSTVSEAPYILGELTIGEARATRLIKQITPGIDRARLSILDGPPGNSCAAVAAIEPADHVVIVMEATPFGLHDMQQTRQVVETLKKPWSLVVNKEMDTGWTHKVLETHGLSPVARIPLRREFFQAAQQGNLFMGDDPVVRQQLEAWFGDKGWS